MIAGALSRGHCTAVKSPIELVAAALRQAKSVLAITGAVMSADSGLPTYRYGLTMRCP